MSKEQFILQQLDLLFPNAQCELTHRTSFELLIAVVLSAQTTDKAVNQITPNLFLKYPDAKSLANSNLEDVEQLIRRIGLYRNKAKNIKALADKLVQDFSGNVPGTMKELLTLPGVGRKTANVVLNVCFDVPTVAVDTHVERVSKRLKLAKNDDSVLQVEQKIKRRFARKYWNKLHHQFIFFGRYLCLSRNPKCEQCPFKDNYCCYVANKK